MRVEIDRDTRRFQSQALQRAPAAIAFVISDTGIGIPADKQQIIFEAFQQADTSTSRIYGGTGLGLTISRELARLLGGEIHLRSTPGVGSTFTLYVPLGPDDQKPTHEDRGHGTAHTTTIAPKQKALADAPSRDRSVDQQELAGKTVLVIDDDVRNLFAVTSLLEKRGINVIPASSAKEGFDLLEQHPDIAVVLIDMMMPEMDGYAATQFLRRDPRYRKLPIVALTAKAMPGDKDKALAAGCDDFVPKPVERDHLLSVLQRWTRDERGDEHDAR